MDIEELIRYHNECVYLDFKLDEYSKEKKAELIKDVMSFANAHHDGDKYIIIGIKKEAGKHIYNSIDAPKDSAGIQQTILHNIEPELDISYTPFHLDGIKYMVLTIKSPQNQPYLAKKTINSENGKAMLIEGDCWVRKGDLKLKATRKDFDRMYLRHLESRYFKGDVEILFTPAQSRRLCLQTIGDIELPSTLTQERIRKIIDKKEALRAKDPKAYEFSNINLAPMFSGRPYEKRSIEELKKILETLREDFFEKDMHHVYEERSHRVNLSITNRGNEYIEDASIQVRIKRSGGLAIADVVYKVRESSSNPMLPYVPRVASYSELNYPSVEVIDDFYVISEDIGDLKHDITQNAFKVPLRLVIENNAVEREIPVECLIRAKNLKEPIKQILIIEVV